uniref:Uncharacterized protein n=1 Tax=Astyanax mexicanus TaxID=7994 RepID=A0A8B9JGR5_ASTMX
FLLRTEYIRPSNLQAFANNSTLHGMRHIFAYGHFTFRRFLWTVSFLGSLGLLLMVCIDRLTYYFQFPHVTKVEDVAAPNLTFPAVTFCNLNEFRYSQITKNDLYHAGRLLALLNRNKEIAKPHLADPEFLASLKKKANFSDFEPMWFNMTDFYNRVGHDISDMLLQCTFHGVHCFPSNFTTVSYYKFLLMSFASPGDALLVLIIGSRNKQLLFTFFHFSSQATQNFDYPAVQCPALKGSIST